MNSKQILAGAIGGLALIAGMTLAPQTASAKVVKNSFLVTQKTITTTNSKKQVKLTVPKGTTVRAAGLKTVGGSRYVYLDADYMNYNLRRPVLSSKATSHISRWLRLSSANFKRVAKPKYLTYYTVPSYAAQSAYRKVSVSGNLWKGSTMPVNYASTSGTRLRVTDDGYLEYFQSTPYVYKKTPKPTNTVKVLSATHPGGSGKTTLTVTKAFSGLPFTTTANGRAQLEIQLTSTRNMTAIPNLDNAQRLLIAQISTIGGTGWVNHKATVTFAK